MDGSNVSALFRLARRIRAMPLKMAAGRLGWFTGGIALLVVQGTLALNFGRLAFSGVTVSAEVMEVKEDTCRSRRSSYTCYHHVLEADSWQFKEMLNSPLRPGKVVLVRYWPQDSSHREIVKARMTTWQYLTAEFTWLGLIPLLGAFFCLATASGVEDALEKKPDPDPEQPIPSHGTIQKVIAWSGGSLALLLILFPRWTVDAAKIPRSLGFPRHSFVLSPPPTPMQLKVIPDWNHLVLMLLVVGAVTAFVYAYCADSARTERAYRKLKGWVRELAFIPGMIRLCLSAGLLTLPFAALFFLPELMRSVTPYALVYAGEVLVRGIAALVCAGAIAGHFARRYESAVASQGRSLTGVA